MSIQNHIAEVLLQDAHTQAFTQKAIEDILEHTRVVLKETLLEYDDDSEEDQIDAAISGMDLLAEAFTARANRLKNLKENLHA